MFRHSTGWGLNAIMFRLVLDNEHLQHPAFEHLRQIVRDEIAQDPDLVWC